MNQLHECSLDPGKPMTTAKFNVVDFRAQSLRRAYQNT